MQASLIESEDEHHWVLLEHRVTEISLSRKVVRLRTWSLDASVEISLSSPFQLRLESGAVKTLDAARPESLSPLLGYLGAAVQSITVARDGEMTVELGGGAVIETSLDPRLVSWELLGGGVLEGMSYRGAPGQNPW
jgi:hypothetical protein